MKSHQLSLVRAATSIIFVEKKGFVATNTCLSGQDTSFVATKTCLPQQQFCHDKNMFVVRKCFCCDKTFVVTNTKIFSHNKHHFLCAGAILFCHNKTFVATNICCDKTFVSAPTNQHCITKHIKNTCHTLNTVNSTNIAPVSRQGCAFLAFTPHVSLSLFASHYVSSAATQLQHVFFQEW